MDRRITATTGRSPIMVAAGFLGAFIVASLAVQLVQIQSSSIQAGTDGVEPVVASQATLWSDLGNRD